MYIVWIRKWDEKLGRETVVQRGTHSPGVFIRMRDRARENGHLVCTVSPPGSESIIRRLEGKKLTFNLTPELVM